MDKSKSADKDKALDESQKETRLKKR